MKQLTAALLLFIISATAGVTREVSYSCSLPPLAFKFYQMGDGNLYDIEVIRGTAVDLFSAVEADLQGSGVCRHRVWSFDYDGPITVKDIYLFMLTTWLETSRGHPEIHEFPNVQRIADAVMLRPSVQLVYGN